MTAVTAHLYGYARTTYLDPASQHRARKYILNPERERPVTILLRRAKFVKLICTCQLDYVMDIYQFNRV